MKLIKIGLKLILLPVLCVAWMMKWIGNFCVFCSAWIFHVLAFIIAITAVLSLGFGLEDGATVVRMLGGAFVLFLIPHVASYIVAAVSVLHSAIHRFIWH
ncbi:MAG: hypothetical protein LUD78_01645 [Clostridiales bacterium]|nr:hypothetical protein [Clostridiales bacterium]